MGQNVGKNFEEKVATIYRRLGFKVTTNIEVPSKQIDLIAEKHIQGIGTTRLMVECKYRSSDPLSNTEVHEFVTTFKALADDYGFDRGVLISKSGFTKNAKAILLNNKKVDFLTFAELECEIINFSHVIDQKIEEYEADEIHDLYFPIEAEGAFKRNEPHLSIKDIGSSILEWSIKKPAELLLVFGDFGSGKSTILENINYKSLKDLKKNHHAFKPILFKLRDYYHFEHIDTYIKYVFDNYYATSVSPQDFWTLAKEKAFLLLVDGFDEISSRVDPLHRKKTFQSIAKLLNSGSPTVLTCRPSYFLDDQEWESLFDEFTNYEYSTAIDFVHKGGNAYRSEKSKADKLLKKINRRISTSKSEKLRKRPMGVFHLSLLNEEKIYDYFKKFEKEILENQYMSIDDVISKIHDIYDIRDLISRPILLKMVAETVKDGDIQLNKAQLSMGPTLLYEVYTQASADREWCKGDVRQLFSSEQRLAFSEMLAYSMFTNDVLEAEYENIVKLTETVRNNYSIEEFQDLKNTKISDTSEDGQICAFLKREGSKFLFTHKSFMEFFLARFINRKFDKFGIKFLNESILPNEIIYFLGGYTFENNFSLKVLNLVNDCSNSILFRNLSSCLFFSGNTLKGHTLSPTHENRIYNLSFRKNKIEGLSVQNTKFDKVKFRGSEFATLAFKACTINTLFSLTKFKKCNVELIANDSEFTSALFESCEITKKLSAVKYYMTTFLDSYSHIMGAVDFDQCDFKFGALKIDVSEEENVRFYNSTFHDLNVEFGNEILSGAKIFVSGSRFERCNILGLTYKKDVCDYLIRINSFKIKDAEKFVVDKRIDHPIFTNCEGLLICDDEMEELFSRPVGKRFKEQATAYDKVISSMKSRTNLAMEEQKVLKKYMNENWINLRNGFLLISKYWFTHSELYRNEVLNYLDKSSNKSFKEYSEKLQSRFNSELTD
ncbi:MAG: restriction endonuclease [Methylocystaceae bacterium]|nr:restriction endonuclease [Methylocystaceae bacterium]